MADCSQANHLLSTTNDTSQSVLVLGSKGSVPYGDGTGQYGLNDGSVDVHHHGLWQVKLLQLPQEVHPLYILCCVFFVRELMFGSHFRSWETIVPRKCTDSTQC